MKTIDNFILGLDGQQEAIVSFLHYRITNHHELVGKIHWNIPTYYQKSLICYLNPIKNDGIELAFLRGAKLSNEQGVLNQKGRKFVAGIDIFDPGSIDERVVDELINEALILDQIHAK